MSRRLTWFALGALSVLLVELGVIAVWPHAPQGAASRDPARSTAVSRAPAAPPVIAPATPPAAAAPASLGELPAPSPAQPHLPLDGGTAGTPAGGGALLIPVRGVRPDQLVDTYTQARGEGRRHDAIDIPAPLGTPVVAVADGTVLKLFQSVRGGTTVYQLAPDRHTIYYYAHLQRYAQGLMEGDRLHAGDLIGYVGDSGNAGPGNYHLHFEISITDDPRRYWGGVPLNPYPLLRGATRGP